MNALKFAQDLYEQYDPSWGGGFNSRILGYPAPNVQSHSEYAKRIYGWQKADELVRKGDIYAIHPLPHSGCSGYAFLYGGTWVCNSCGQSGLNKYWWQIKCAPDGNAWCCVGPDFQNLQESDNYAFGDTRDLAIEAYGKLMLASELKGGEGHE